MLWAVWQRIMLKQLSDIGAAWPAKITEHGELSPSIRDYLRASCKSRAMTATVLKHEGIRDYKQSARMVPEIPCVGLIRLCQDVEELTCRNP